MKPTGDLIRPLVIVLVGAAHGEHDGRLSEPEP